MSKFKNICVYCGASQHIEQKQLGATAELGKYLAASGRTLIYGGGKSGNMGRIADSVLENGGKAIGITPVHIDNFEARHENLTELHIVATLHERKMMMAEKSDAFIVLPGGFGTLDEFFEILTWKQLGLHNKPIIILNIFGFWDILQALIKHMVNEKFVAQHNLALCDFATSIDEAFSILESYELEPEQMKLQKI